MAISSVSTSNTNSIFQAPIRPLTSQEAFDEAFKGIPEDQWDLLVLDRDKWETTEPLPKVDATAFTEPNYALALIKTLKNVIREDLDMTGKDVEKRYNADKLRDLHDSCVDGVFHDAAMTDPFLKGYKPGYHFGVLWQEIPEEALEELRKEKILHETDHRAFSRDDGVREAYMKEFQREDDDFEYLVTSNPTAPGVVRFYSRFRKAEELPIVHKKINALFDKYYNAIASAHSEDDKLAAIVNLCRALDIFHVFPDGNSRTILFTLLQKLLIENGFSPVILSCPERTLGGYHTTQKTVTLFKQGMENYARVVEQLKTFRQ